MPGVTREADLAGGAIKAGSPNVFVNGKSATVVGIGIEPHGSSPHRDAKLSVGSSTVFVNGKALVRAGDKATCGHAASGSSNVSAGG